VLSTYCEFRLYNQLRSFFAGHVQSRGGKISAKTSETLSYAGPMLVQALCWLYAGQNRFSFVYSLCWSNPLSSFALLVQSQFLTMLVQNLLFLCVNSAGPQSMSLFVGATRGEELGNRETDGPAKRTDDSTNRFSNHSTGTACPGRTRAAAAAAATTMWACFCWFPLEALFISLRIPRVDELAERNARSIAAVTSNGSFYWGTRLK